MLAVLMAAQRMHVTERCSDCRTVTAAAALTLARVFGDSPRQRQRIERVIPLDAL